MEDRNSLRQPSPYKVVESIATGDTAEIPVFEFDKDLLLTPEEMQKAVLENLSIPMGEAIRNAQISKVLAAGYKSPEEVYNQTMRAKQSGWDDAVKFYEAKVEEAKKQERERIIKFITARRNSRLCLSELLEALRGGGK